MSGEDAKQPRGTKLSDQAASAVADLLCGQLKNGSAEEKYALGALGWCFSNPARVDRGIWLMLEWAVDPALRDSAPARIEFKRSRPRGRPKTPDREIAEFIWRRVKEAGWKRDAAYAAAAETFKVSYKAAYNAYKNWEPKYEKFGARSKMFTRIYRSSALEEPTSSK